MPLQESLWHVPFMLVNCIYGHNFRNLDIFSGWVSCVFVDVIKSIIVICWILINLIIGMYDWNNFVIVDNDIYNIHGAYYE